MVEVPPQRRDKEARVSQIQIGDEMEDLGEDEIDDIIEVLRGVGGI